MARKADQASKTVVLDSSGFKHVNHGVAKFYESGQSTVILGGVIDTTKRGATPSYYVAIENGNVPEHAQAHLQRAPKGPNRRRPNEGSHDCGEETKIRDDGSVGTLDHSGTDNVTDFEGGARVSTGPSYERDCETKQFVRWTSTGDNGSVDWAWRGWCSWSGVDWETLGDGFSGSNYEADGEYYTRSYGDYSPVGEDDKVYHRIKLWAQPDGNMRWEAVMTAHNAEFSENYGHTADVYYSDDPYQNC